MSNTYALRTPSYEKLELYLAYIYILNPVIKLFLTKYYKNSTVYVLSYSYD